MSLDSFNARIDRIANKTHYSPADMARGDGVAVLRFSSPLEEKPSVRNFYQVMLMGLVLGLITGVLAAGSVNPAALWGPGTEYHVYVALPASVALTASPFIAILGCMLRSRSEAFFYGAAAFFPAVLAAAFYGADLL